MNHNQQDSRVPTTHEHRRNPSVLILTRKPRRTKGNNQFECSGSEMGDTSEVRDDMKKMRNYIVSRHRHSALDGRVEAPSRLKTLYNPNRSVT